GAADTGAADRRCDALSDAGSTGRSGARAECGAEARLRFGHGARAHPQRLRRSRTWIQRFHLLGGALLRRRPQRPGFLEPAGPRSALLESPSGTDSAPRDPEAGGMGAQRREAHRDWDANPARIRLTRVPDAGGRRDGLHALTTSAPVRHRSPLAAPPD